jgi:hypothetical protein
MKLFHFFRSGISITIAETTIQNALNVLESLVGSEQAGQFRCTDEFPY